MGVQFHSLTGHPLMSGSYKNLVTKTVIPAFLWGNQAVEQRTATE